MPEEVRAFLRSWVAALKQLPVDHPTIQEMPISFEGFGEALYCANVDDIERFFIKDSAHKTGATLSLALSLWSDLSKEKVCKVYSSQRLCNH